MVPDDMKLVPGGAFRMGSDTHFPEEAPTHAVSVGEFWMDPYPVTNRRFEAFVAATDYVTVAERPLDPHDFPGAPVENLVPGSMVFTMTAGPVDLRDLSQWWAWTPGASWRHPHGSSSNIEGRGDHPVVHVAYEDALAFAHWSGKDLPTEPEWERAARGGLDGKTFVWGDQPELPSQRLANYWHGAFPWSHDDGYGTLTPVGSFPPNGYGLFDMAGNVWEWTTDWWGPNHRLNQVTGAALRMSEPWRRSTTAMTPPSPSSKSPARSSRVDRSSVPTATASATGRRLGARR